MMGIRGRNKIRPLGIEETKKMMVEFPTLFYPTDMDPENNVRKCHCKICGNELSKGQGRKWIYFNQLANCTHIFRSQRCNCDYNFTYIYMCGSCEKAIELII